MERGSDGSVAPMIGGPTVVRAFGAIIQLTAIGYVIDVIFGQDNLAFVFALLAAMVRFGAVAGATTLGLVLVLGVFDPEAATWCPSAGW